MSNIVPTKKENKPDTTFAFANIDALLLKVYREIDLMFSAEKFNFLNAFLFICFKTCLLTTSRVDYLTSLELNPLFW